ncbi:MAG: hypothetical protein ACI9MR_004536 [Myxococcota bacterium]|jgi:hypothetical protein
MVGIGATSKRADHEAIDRDRLLDAVGGDFALLGSTLEMFLDQVHTLVATVRDGVADNDHVRAALEDLRGRLGHGV